jgi:hypothetical protein
LNCSVDGLALGTLLSTTSPCVTEVPAVVSMPKIRSLVPCMIDCPEIVAVAVVMVPTIWPPPTPVVMVNAPPVGLWKLPSGATIVPPVTTPLAFTVSVPRAHAPTLPVSSKTCSSLRFQVPARSEVAKEAVGVRCSRNIPRLGCAADCEKTPPRADEGSAADYSGAPPFDVKKTPLGYTRHRRS